jgi:5-methyltetrahydrofolate--homocysteine methyltransferase
VDVPNEEVVRRVSDEKPDFLGLSALLTTTMAEQGTIIRLLKEQGIRDQVKVMIGGAPVTREFCQRIDADGYSDDAVSAVSLAGSFTG